MDKETISWRWPVTVCRGGDHLLVLCDTYQVPSAEDAGSLLRSSSPIPATTGCSATQRCELPQRVLPSFRASSSIRCLTPRHTIL